MKPIYLINAIMALALGLSNLLDWPHDDGRFRVLLGLLLISVSLVWLIGWFRMRRRESL